MYRLDFWSAGIADSISLASKADAKGRQAAFQIIYFRMDLLDVLFDFKYCDSPLYVHLLSILNYFLVLFVVLMLAMWLPLTDFIFAFFFIPVVLSASRSKAAPLMHLLFVCKSANANVLDCHVPNHVFYSASERLFFTIW